MATMRIFEVISDKVVQNVRLSGKFLIRMEKDNSDNVIWRGELEKDATEKIGFAKLCLELIRFMLWSCRMQSRILRAV